MIEEEEGESKRRARNKRGWKSGKYYYQYWPPPAVHQAGRGSLRGTNKYPFRSSKLQSDHKTRAHRGNYKGELREGTSGTGKTISIEFAKFLVPSNCCHRKLFSQYWHLLFGLSIISDSWLLEISSNRLPNFAIGGVRFIAKETLDKEKVGEENTVPYEVMYSLIKKYLASSQRSTRVLQGDERHEGIPGKPTQRKETIVAFQGFPHAKTSCKWRQQSRWVCAQIPSPGHHWFQGGANLH